jgi:hypothetical protein
MFMSCLERHRHLGISRVTILREHESFTGKCLTEEHHDDLPYVRTHKWNARRARLRGLELFVQSVYTRTDKRHTVCPTCTRPAIRALARQGVRKRPKLSSFRHDCSQWSR